MKILPKLLIFVLLFLLPALVRADTQIITLKDGSQIKGELVGVSNGVYTIKTSLLGDVHISAGQVASISNGVAPPAPAGPAQTATAGYGQQPAAATNPYSQQIQAAQAQILGNPAIVSELQNMMQDPEIQQIITDPAFMQAVTAQDVHAVQNNPRAQQLINNPKIKALIEKLRGSGLPSSQQ